MSEYPKYSNLVQPGPNEWTWTQTFVDVEGDWGGGVEVECERDCSVRLDPVTSMLHWSWSASSVPPGSYLSHPGASGDQPLRRFGDMAPGLGFDVPPEVKSALRARKAAADKSQD